LNNHKEISDYTIEKLIELEKQGYQIILGSGRYFKEIKRFADALELEKYHGYAVCGNGYEVIDIQNDTHKTFEENLKIKQEIEERFIKSGVQGTITMNDDGSDGIYNKKIVNNLSTYIINFK
jgi:hydroxymethylpyrimidine pyrophosphatase-like HAD family hydrolase